MSALSNRLRSQRWPPVALLTELCLVGRSSCSDPLWAGGHPTHMSAQLLQQNLDGTQVVELRRPPGRSFGFFLARGRVHAHHGVFVSRMPDSRTQQVSGSSVFSSYSVVLRPRASLFSLKVGIVAP
ncbi:hypothetical protein V5799_026056 [Amblyomma americanum]|uniref:Uncharacterized protein n=1 Tax=Amblyomma americanum TaxID=6943 RepID=A0AAQ4DJN8_AMBAM